MTTTTRPHELIPTHDLLQELFARYETAVFVGHVPWVPEAGLEQVRINWQGNMPTALGLASRLTHEINRKMDARDGPGDDDA